jgi:hypothetical protein
VKQFAQRATEAEPYSRAIAAGAMEPPPGSEQIAEMGLPAEDQSRLAGIEAFQGAELARQQYDTPQQTALGPMAPKDIVALRAQDMRAKAEQLRLIAQDERQDERLRFQAEHQARQIDAMMTRMMTQQGQIHDRWMNMPTMVPGMDAEGNPTTNVFSRGALSQRLAEGGEGAPLQFDKPLPAAERTKTKETEVGLQKMENLIQSFKPEYVGPLGSELKTGKMSGTAYKVAEKLPDFGQIDPFRSDFVAQNADLKNSVIRAITGAQLQGAAEAERIMAQVPDASRDNSAVWQAKANRTLKNMQILLQVQRGQINSEAARTLFDFGQLQGGAKAGLTPPPTAPGRPTTAEEYLAKIKGQQ